MVSIIIIHDASSHISLSIHVLPISIFPIVQYLDLVYADATIKIARKI